MSTRGKVVPRRGRGREESFLVFGRNFVETVILTFIKMEMAHPDVKVAERVIRWLEDEVVCALGLANPVVSNVYREMTLKIIDEMFPDLPKPELTGCFIYDQVMLWVDKYWNEIYPKFYQSVKPHERDTQVMNIAIRIIRRALFATLYKVGYLSR